MNIASNEALEKRYGAQTVERYLANLEIVRREDECLADGEDLDEIERPYHLYQKDFERLQHYLAVCHKLVAGLLADEYFLVDALAELRRPDWKLALRDKAKVVRGGSWRNDPKSCRSTSRNAFVIDRRSNDAGFRVCEVMRSVSKTS